MTVQTVGQAIVEALVVEQVTHAFGLAGSHILGIYDALADAYAEALQYQTPTIIDVVSGPPMPIPTIRPCCKAHKIRGRSGARYRSFLY